MHEGGITDHTHGVLVSVASVHLVETVNRAYRTAHAKTGLDGIQRCSRSQRITADIPQNGTFVLRELIEHSAVRTTGTHGRRTHRNRCIQCAEFCFLSSESLRHEILGKLSDNRKQFLSLYINAKYAAVILDDRI